MTLTRLHAEHVADRAHRYSQFAQRYRQWRAVQKRSIRQQHVAGDKAFIDHAGPIVAVIDRRTGEVRRAQIFVAVLGASSYTFAEATRTQSMPDWIGSNRRMPEFFGGVPALLVPDNLRSATTTPCRYEPTVNETCLELARHYGRLADAILDRLVHGSHRLELKGGSMRKARADAELADGANLTERDRSK